MVKAMLLLAFAAIVAFGQSPFAGRDNGRGEPTVVVTYMNAQGCANAMAVTGSPTCTQTVTVDVQTADMRVMDFDVTLYFFDQEGNPQIMRASAPSHPSNGVMAGAVFFVGGVDNIPGAISAMVIPTASNGQFAMGAYQP